MERRAGRAWGSPLRLVMTWQSQGGGFTAGEAVPPSSEQCSRRTVDAGRSGRKVKMIKVASRNKEMCLQLPPERAEPYRA